jgi:lipopolysaccharide export LptBFGC system permease protein LptF
MSTLQTLLALVVLIFVLSVIVQAVQDVLKSWLDTKASTLEDIIRQFMGKHLDLSQVQDALQTRGLDITALDHFNKDEFRTLLDGIKFDNTQLQGIVAKEQASLEEAKDHIAAAYEGARAKFRKIYALKNKKIAVIVSFGVVLALNASVIRLYEILSANQSMSQAISGTASSMLNAKPPDKNSGDASQQPNLADVYAKNRTMIESDLQKYPILLRTRKYPEDFRQEAANEVIGLVVMALLVSLGAPFWNDVLKGLTGVNNALNTGDKKSS